MLIRNTEFYNTKFKIIIGKYAEVLEKQVVRKYFKKQKGS